MRYIYHGLYEGFGSAGHSFIRDSAAAESRIKTDDFIDIVIDWIKDHELKLVRGIIEFILLNSGKKRENIKANAQMAVRVCLERN